MRAAVRSLGELLITLGVVLLLFVGWQLWWTDVEAGREQRASVEALRDAWSDRPDTVPAAATTDPPDLTAPPEGDAFGLVHVPRFGDDYDVPVHEGVDLADVLNHGVLGHYPGTAMPGDVGNFSVAGHRVTYGRPLAQVAELETGDPVVVETADAWYVYRVRSTEIVTPDQVEVVAPVPGQPAAQPTERLMTLTACHPMYSARERFVVHAAMESWQPKSAGTPAVLAAGAQG